MSSNLIDFEAERAYTPVILGNLAHILKSGISAPALRIHDPHWEELHSADHLTKLQSKVLNLPGRPTAAELIDFTYVPGTPFGLHIATGHAGVKLRANREIILLQVSPSSLDRHKTAYYRTDRTLLSPDARFALDRSLLLDHKHLRSRDFRLGRNSEFGAGLVVVGSVPTMAIERLVCSDDSTRHEVIRKVTAAALTIQVTTDRLSYFWPPQQIRLTNV